MEPFTIRSKELRAAGSAGGGLRDEAPATLASLWERRFGDAAFVFMVLAQATILIELSRLGSTPAKDASPPH
jgi:hypothetical protein